VHVIPSMDMRFVAVEWPLSVIVGDRAVSIGCLVVDIEVSVLGKLEECARNLCRRYGRWQQRRLVASSSDGRPAVIPSKYDASSHAGVLCQKAWMVFSFHLLGGRCIREGKADLSPGKVFHRQSRSTGLVAAVDDPVGLGLQAGGSFKECMQPQATMLPRAASQESARHSSEGRGSRASMEDEATSTLSGKVRA
jgi:hypothetical protein